MMKLVVGKYCSRCKYVEDRIDRHNVEIIDVDSVEAMTLFALNELLTVNPVSLPVLFRNDESYLTGDLNAIISEINGVVKL